MREIKFRAWDKELKMMVYSKEQAGHIEYDTNPVDSINIMLNEDDYGLEYMQYTGLKDKNGKDIYEGDIVEFSNKLHGYINFKEAKFIIVYIEKNLPKQIQDCGTYLNCYEVIGNIYGNPELLK